MSTIAAGTTSTTALVNTGDTTGNLVFQTNGTTTAMTIDTSQNVALTAGLSVAGNNISAVNSMGFRNRIINGAMMVNQRATSITDGGYSVDRWEYSSSASAKFTVAKLNSNNRFYQFVVSNIIFIVFSYIWRLFHAKPKG